MAPPAADAHSAGCRCIVLCAAGADLKPQTSRAARSPELQGIGRELRAHARHAGRVGGDRHAAVMDRCTTEIVGPLEELTVLDFTLVDHPHLKRGAKRVVTRRATAHELHYRCETYNWDDGMKLLRWAVKQPQCDPATALMIYFRAQPDHFFALEDGDEDDWRMVKFLESIERRFSKAGTFNPASVSYDPVKDVGREAVLHKDVPRSMNMRAVAVKGAPKYRYPRVGQ